MTLILFLLFTKHFIIDFLWQPPFEWQNKGTYGHPGGLQHALKHTAATWLIIAGLTHDAGMATWLASADMLIHYHVDWAKMQMGERYNLHAKCEPFWWLLGLDQYLHYLTYLGIAWAVAAV